MSWTEWGEGAISAADVRKMPGGTQVFLHYRDRYTEHRRRLMTIVIIPRGKFLYDGSDGLDPADRYKPIRCTKNQYFTLANFD